MNGRRDFFVDDVFCIASGRCIDKTHSDRAVDVGDSESGHKELGKECAKWRPHSNNAERSCHREAGDSCAQANKLPSGFGGKERRWPLAEGTPMRLLTARTRCYTAEATSKNSGIAGTQQGTVRGGTIRHLIEWIRCQNLVESGKVSQEEMATKKAATPYRLTAYGSGG